MTQLDEQNAVTGEPLPPIPDEAYDEQATPLDEPPDQPEDAGDDDDGMGGDPLAISQMLLASAADRILQHKQGGTLNDKVALGHALATFALAAAIRQQTAIMANAQALELARMQQRQQPGVTESGIVVPR